MIFKQKRLKPDTTPSRRKFLAGLMSLPLINHLPWSGFFVDRGGWVLREDDF